MYSCDWVPDGICKMEKVMVIKMKLGIDITTKIHKTEDLI